MAQEHPGLATFILLPANQLKPKVVARLIALLKNIFVLISIDKYRNSLLESI